GLISTLLAVFAPPSSQAAGRLSVSSPLGGAVASAGGPTQFDVRGTGYQVVRGGFGGIYVAFGWVNERTWRPSQGGMTGTDYRYVPDSESQNNAGYLGFVAFPGSSTEGEAQAVMSDNGSWRLTLNVPGPEFTAQDRSGRAVRVNCLQVTCGFVTFGAHGVKNAQNEAFIPVTFQGGGTGGGGGTGAGAAPGATPGGDANGGAASAAPAHTQQQVRGAAERPQAAASGQVRSRGGSPQAASSAEEVSTTETGETARAAGAAADSGVASNSGGAAAGGAIKITVDRASARPGGALAYTAYGFWPGEQATISLGQGIAAAGPLTTGVDGEIAGVLVIPDDIEPGTHEIRAVGAGSGLEGSERFAVSELGLLSSEGTFSNYIKWDWVFLAVAVLVLLASVAWVVSRRMGWGSDDDEEIQDIDSETTKVDNPVNYYGAQSANSSGSVR
ncbi:MAG: hypothetical protein U1C73_01420, partial [Dietzia sp.]|nr:hypothetical protein [Dietzia sp.]